MMKPCKHLDYTEGRYGPDIELRSCAPHYPDVRYWQRGPLWTDNGPGEPSNPAKCQFCSAGRGRIPGVFAVLHRRDVVLRARGCRAVTDTLLCCPFCGGVAAVAPWVDPPGVGGTIARIRCTRCAAQSASYADASYAAEAWNTREPSQSEARLREMLCRVVDTTPLRGQQ